jgi:hypothetical protein
MLVHILRIGAFGPTTAFPAIGARAPIPEPPTSSSGNAHGQRDLCPDHLAAITLTSG